MITRVREAAQILKVTPQTVRNWCNQGKLEYELSAAGQRIFDPEKLEAYKRKQLGIPEPKPTEHKIFYTRTSSKQDVSLENQYEKLVKAYGEPDYKYKDFSSGLNENRKGLNKLIKDLEKLDGTKTIYVTNKDRLTRFGFKYLTELFKTYNATVVSLDDDETKEPLEILMQEFMNLLSSYAGKFYRLRGWEQRKQFLTKVQTEVDTRATT